MRFILFVFSPGDSQGGVFALFISQQLVLRQGVSWTTQNTLLITAFGIVFNNVLFFALVFKRSETKKCNLCKNKNFMCSSNSAYSIVEKSKY